MKKPLLIGTLPHIAKAFSENWNLAKADLQKVIDIYNGIGLDAITSSEELKRLLVDTDLFIFDRMTGGGAQIVGTHGKNMEIDKTHAFSILQKPKGYPALKDAIKEYERVCMAGKEVTNPSTRVLHGIAETTNHFTIENGVLQFTEKLQNLINDAGNIYSKTEKGQAAYEFLQLVTDAYFSTGLDEHFKTSNNSNLTGEKVGEFISKGLKEIDVATKKAKVGYTVSSGINPVFALDNF